MKTDVSLIVGDPFLRAQKIKAIVSETEKVSGGPVARQAFDLDETSFEAVLSAARTLPFFHSQQVICVQGAQLLSAPDLKVLESYIGHSTQGTTLILESDDAKGVSDLQKLIKDNGQVIHLAKDDARAAGASYIQQKLTRHQKTMTSGAKARMIAMCGDAVMFLDSTIERLVQFAGERREIDEDMVAQFEENWTEMDVFKLTNAFVDRDPARAFKVFRDLMEFYEADLFSLIGILHWQLRQLWQAAKLLSSGVSEREISSKLRMPPHRLNALRRLPLERLESAIEALYQIDRKSKSGQTEGVSGLEAWILEFTA